MPRLCLAFAAAIALGLSACGSSDPGTGDDDDDLAGADAAPVPDDYVMLAAGDWSMPAGTEGYYCVRTTVTEDIYIREFRPVAPLGTHHTALAVDQGGGEDGTFPCSASDTGFKLLFGSGVGTEPFALPEGVAFKIMAGTQLMLNLHLYNTTEDAIVGTSGVEVKLLPAAEVVHEAETVYVMNFDLSVPPGPSTHNARCTIADDTTVFGVFPHMHTLGVNMKGTALFAQGEPREFFDEPYSFEDQQNYLIDPPVALVNGDIIESECAFMNPGSTTVEFGDSTDAEMCVLGLYRYPARDGFGLCFN